MSNIVRILALIAIVATVLCIAKPTQCHQGGPRRQIVRRLPPQAHCQFTINGETGFISATSRDVTDHRFRNTKSANRRRFEEEDLIHCGKKHDPTTDTTQIQCNCYRDNCNAFVDADTYFQLHPNVIWMNQTAENIDEQIKF